MTGWNTVSKLVLAHSIIIHATHCTILLPLDIGLLVPLLLGSTDIWAMATTWYPWLQLVICFSLGVLIDGGGPTCGLFGGAEYCNESGCGPDGCGPDSLLCAAVSSTWLMLRSLERRSHRCVVIGHLILQHRQIFTLTPSAGQVLLRCTIVLFGDALGHAVVEALSSMASIAKVTSTVGVQAAQIVPSASSNDHLDLSPVIQWEHIDLLHQIGTGAFGSVFAVRYFGTLASVKVVHKGKASPEYLKHEAELMLTLRHPHVCMTLGLISDGRERHGLLMELMSRSLDQLLKDAHQRLCWPTPLIRIALQVSQAMSYLVGCLPHS